MRSKSCSALLPPLTLHANQVGFSPFPQRGELGVGGASWGAPGSRCPPPPHGTTASELRKTVGGRGASGCPKCPRRACEHVGTATPASVRPRDGRANCEACGVRIAREVRPRDGRANCAKRCGVGITRDVGLDCWLRIARSGGVSKLRVTLDCTVRCELREAVLRANCERGLNLQLTLTLGNGQSVFDSEFCGRTNRR